MLSAIQQANQGRKILTDWLGAGGEPVAIELAQARANICLKCPLNYRGGWLWSMATAIAISSQMKLRETMGIKLEREEELAVCEACGCQLKLKVHVPFSHLYRHTSIESFTKLPAHCWVRTEFDQLQKTPAP